MSRPRAVLTLWLVCIAALGSWTGVSLRIETDLSQFLPGATSMDDRLLLFQLRQGAAARMLLIGITGGDSELVRAQASRGLAERLRVNPRLSSVANGELDLSGAQSLQALFRYRYLIGPDGPCADALTSAGLSEALAMRLDELAAPIPPIDKDRIAADPTACFREFLLGMIPPQAPERSHGVWFSPDRSRALMVVQTRADASDLPAQRVVVEDVREAFSSLPQAEGLQIQLAGPAYFAVGSEAAIRSEIILLSTAASLLVVGILTYAFRSVRLVLLGVLPLLSGLLAGVVLVMVVFGQIHGITLALGITLLGVTLDYPIHVFAHMVPEDNGGGAEQSGLWHVLFLGAVTTALGYLALALTSFEGLAQLGVLSAAGLAVAVLCSRFLLPILTPDTARLPRRAWLQEVARGLPCPTAVARGLVVLGALALLGYALSHSAAPLDTDLSRLSTVPEEELVKDRTLREQLGAPDVSRFLYADAADSETVLRGVEAALPSLRALAADGLIGGFDAPALWLPSVAAQQERQRHLPSPHILTQSLHQAVVGSAFRESAFKPFLDDLEGSRTLQALGRAPLVGTPVETRLSALLQPLGDRWIGLVPLSGISGTDAVEALRKIAKSKGLHYLDLREAASELLGRFMDNALYKLLAAALVILIVLLVALRDVDRSVSVLTPIVASTSLVLALLLLLRGAVNLFHLVSLLLVVGLVIDYSLFFNRPARRIESRARTLLSVLVCALSSFSMFGMLAFSDIPALHSIGLTVALGIAVSFPIALLLGRSKGELA